ncbi:hypothetical protein FACS1894137_09630 [Spirochaetia bacterium]|nr:hypothetical protein FACS1894137_09630 [Spirochaetia bacterium]
MAFCSSCGTQVAEGVKFCTSCGAAIGGAAAPAPKPAKEKVGNIRVCPNCGETVEAFQTRCSSCGHEFRDAKVSSNVQAFFETLDKVDQEMATRGDTGVRGSFLGMGGGISAANQRKLELIKNYPIPTSKEDLLEFIILSASHIETEGPSSANNMNYFAEKKVFEAKNSAWKAKINQAQSKAVIAFAGDSVALNQINTITKQVDIALKTAFRKGLFKSPIFVMSAVLVGLILMLVLLIGGGTSGATKEENRLNSLVTEIMADMKEGNYIEAKMKATQLKWTNSFDSTTKKAEWDEQRETILEQIEKLEQKK